VSALVGLVLASLWTVPATVSGQDASADPAPPVEALVARALERAPSLAARRARLDAARAAVGAADALPDPMVEFEYRMFNFPEWTIGSDPGSMIGGSYRQPLLSRGRRETRRAVAVAEAGRRQAEQAALATGLAMQVRLLYARLFVIDRERDTLAEAEELTRLLEATAIARYGAGQGDQAAVLRIQLERTRLGEREVDLDAERATLQAALNRLTDAAPETPIGRVTALPAVAAPVTGMAVADRAAEQATEVGVRKSEIAVAAQQVETSRAELKPAWALEGGMYWQGNTDRMVSLMVGVELPIWKKRRQEPLIAAAEREHRAAELELADTTAEVRAEAARLLVEAEAAKHQVERYRTAILPLSSAALDATRSSYLGGRGDFAALLDEFRRWTEVRVQLARREADRYAALARLDALVAPVEGGTNTEAAREVR
jgi:outer membrane protein TolC